MAWETHKKLKSLDDIAKSIHSVYFGHKRQVYLLEQTCSPSLFTKTTQNKKKPIKASL